jgi:hypothetical protein
MKSYDVLEEASAARYLKNQNYVIRKNWKNLRVNKNEWVKDSERKWSERKKNLHPLVTMDTDSLKEVSNKK